MLPAFVHSVCTLSCRMRTRSAERISIWQSRLGTETRQPFVLRRSGSCRQGPTARADFVRVYRQYKLR